MNISRILTVVFFVLTLWILGQTYAGKRGYTNLQKLRRNLKVQKDKNEELQVYVDDLDEKVYKIHKDDKFLEKTVRNKLLMGKANERIFVFDKKVNK